MIGIDRVSNHVCIYIMCVCALVKYLCWVSLSNIITYSQYKSALHIITYCTILSCGLEFSFEMYKTWRYLESTWFNLTPWHLQLLNPLLLLLLLLDMFFPMISVSSGFLMKISDNARLCGLRGRSRQDLLILRLVLPPRRPPPLPPRRGGELRLRLSRRLPRLRLSLRGIFGARGEGCRIRQWSSEKPKKLRVRGSCEAWWGWSTWQGIVRN